MLSCLFQQSKRSVSNLGRFARSSTIGVEGRVSKKMMKPRSSNSSDGGAIDDPCWGDPQHCSLECLMSLLSQSKVILYQSLDYLVLNKPADLRMDGNYPATVHKLLTYWYPPPSLRSCSSSGLLAKLKELHRHSDIPDNELRPCHQLDYATSGVLLVARNGESAAWASACFQSRRVQKTYSAVLHGHLFGKSELSSLPAVSPEHLTKVVEHEELTYRRTQNKRRPETFNGFQPPNAFLQIFQGRLLRKMTQSKKRKRERLTLEQLEQVDKALELTEEEQAKLAKMPWKVVKKDQKLKHAIERATDQYNKFLRETLKTEMSEQEGDQCDEWKELSTTFRVQGDDDNVFYVYLPLAQVTDEFPMRIPAQNKHDWLQIGQDSLNFKMSLTKFTILSRGHLNGQPVSKVLLEPRTGRRHQLRVHTAWLGHPIVGDQTYEGPYNQASTLSPRMCLHASSLGFPLPAGEGFTNPNIQALKGMLRVTAPDPFDVSEDNKEIKVANL